MTPIIKLRTAAFTDYTVYSIVTVIPKEGLAGHHSLRSPFSLLLVKSDGPNNFWLRQLKIVGVGVNIGTSVGATFGPSVGPTLLGSQNCRSRVSQNTPISSDRGAHLPN